MAKKKVRRTKGSRTSGKPRRPTKKTDAARTELLHTDVIREVLSRLPIDSMARFLCVCKEWADLFLDPVFIDAHSRHVQSKPGLMFCARGEARGLIFFDVETMESRTFPFRLKVQRDSGDDGNSNCDNEIKDFNDLSIRASCEGLVLVRTQECFYVYNPVTGFQVGIPPPPQGC
ncbi:hypothetical protein ACLOJK_017157 [Asimina triloba]